MKKTALAVAALVYTMAWISSGADARSTETEKKATPRLPNSGYVADAATAVQIGKVVLSHLLTPDDFEKKEFSDAKLKDGTWIVSYWEPKTRINFPIVIQIRQKTGTIIKYDFYIHNKENNTTKSRKRRYSKNNRSTYNRHKIIYWNRI